MLACFYYEQCSTLAARVRDVTLTVLLIRITLRLTVSVNFDIFNLLLQLGWVCFAHFVFMVLTPTKFLVWSWFHRKNRGRKTCAAGPDVNRLASIVM